MGNQACCEEQAKGPQFAEYKFKTNTSKIDPHGRSSAFSKTSSHKKELIDKEQPIPTQKIPPVEDPTYQLKEQPGKIKPAFHIQEQKNLPADIHLVSQQSSSLGEAARKKINRSLFHEKSSEKSIKQVESNKPQSAIKSNNGLPYIPTVQLESHRKNMQEFEPQHSSLLQPHPNKKVQVKEQVQQIPQIIIPDLKQEVAVVLQQNKFFQDKNQGKALIRQYGDDYYQGQLDEDRNIPDGFGKFYKKDGSLYTGHFVKGKGNGEGVYIFPDGSYYRGNFNANEAEDEKGTIISKQLQYTGGFLHNKFEGKGKQKGIAHTFYGEYKNGERIRGTLEWSDNGAKYIYSGLFKDQLFHGIAVLKQPKGTYEGNFVEGKKHGYGVYNFANSLCYKGDYQNGLRSGKGALYNCDGTITYEGQFVDGIPHGVGYVVDKNGEKASAKWIEGIDADLL